MELPFNPIERAEAVEKIVMKNNKRKYYRFRLASYYGGIVTADTIGCCFLCAYCWNYFRNLKPENFGEFFSPEEVSEKMVEIARRKNCNRFRISGAEPILGKESFSHLLRIIELTKEKLDNFEFIVETNGLVLGYYPELIKDLQPYKSFVFVRISIKGWDEISFEKISGAKKEYFIYPIEALKKLIDEGIMAWPAVMYEIFGDSGLRKIKERLKMEGIETEVEIEYLERYQFVEENLRKRGLMLRTDR
jgi:uncharacterized Fe-S cluster-containing radical SAM superfamily protein